MVAQQGKDPALSLLWCQFDPWPGNFHMLWAPSKKKKKRERESEIINRNQVEILEWKSTTGDMKNSLGTTTHVRMAQMHDTDMASAGEGVQQQELSLTADETAERYSHFGRHCGAFFTKQKYPHHMIQQPHSLVFTQRSWKLMSAQKTLAMNVYRSFVHNCQNLQANKMSFRRWTTGVPVVAQQKRIWLASVRTHVQSLASLSGLRIWCCCELWYRMQTWLRSHVAVAVV